MKKLSKVYLGLIFVFLYAPILVMVFFSFNASNSTSVFTGFSLVSGAVSGQRNAARFV